jgi:hypothetical protein
MPSIVARYAMMSPIERIFREEKGRKMPLAIRRVPVRKGLTVGMRMLFGCAKWHLGSEDEG